MSDIEKSSRPASESAIVPRPKVTTRIWVRAQVYRIRSVMKSPWWWVRHAFVIGFWVALGWPVYKTSHTLGLLHTVVAVALTFGRAWRYASPKNMEVVQHGYLARKTMLYRLIKEMQHREMKTPSEVRRFQEDALWLIASYVRGHRADHQGVEIFVNLMVEQGDDIVVVARDREHRQPLARYPKEGMLATRCLSTGEAVWTGDVSADFPATSSKPYKSILVLPIHGDDRILGVVSIDSTRSHHFDIEVDELQRYLLPYVCLLGWTLTSNVARLSGVNEPPNSTSSAGGRS